MRNKSDDGNLGQSREKKKIIELPSRLLAENLLKKKGGGAQKNENLKDSFRSQASTLHPFSICYFKLLKLHKL